MIVADWDRGSQWNIFDGTSRRTYTRDEFLHGQAFRDYAGHNVVVEAAHLHERTKRSLAQIYDADELALVSRCAVENGCTICVFPQNLTHRARQESGQEKDGDVIALHCFVSAHPEVSLRRWPFPQQPDLWQAMNEQRDEMSDRLNQMRSDYAASLEVARAREALSSVYTRLEPSTREWFALKVVYAGRPKQRLDFNPPRVMSIYVAVFTEDGQLRRNLQGHFAGVRWIWRLLKMSPYHGKGGTARSNLMYHMLRSAEKGTRDQAARASFRRALKDMARCLRDYGLAAEMPGEAIAA